MTQLTIDGQMAYNTIVLAITVMSFLFVYQKAIRNRVEKSDLKESEDRQNEKIRAVHHRVDGIEKRLDDGIADLHKDVKDILKLLSK